MQKYAMLYTLNDLNGTAELQFYVRDFIPSPRNAFVFEAGVTEISKSLYSIANMMANVAKALSPELLIVSTIKLVKMKSLSVDCYDSVDALLFSLSFTGINADPPKTVLIPNNTSGEMIEIAIEPVESPTDVKEMETLIFNNLNQL